MIEHMTLDDLSSENNVSPPADLRDRLAESVMIGLLRLGTIEAGPGDHGKMLYQVIAERSYSLADQMLIARQSTRMGKH